MVLNFINRVRNRFLSANKLINEEARVPENNKEDSPISTKSEDTQQVRQDNAKPKRRRSRRSRKPGTSQGKAARPQDGAKKSHGKPTEDSSWDLPRFQVEPAEGKTRFHDLGLPDQIMHAIDDLGFQYCTPIQAEILPQVIDGADATGRAQTGTGKSAAFLLAILTRLLRDPLTKKQQLGRPRALILAPTRELVCQIEKDGLALTKYTPVNIISVFGGMALDHQRKQLTEGPVDILVATPGRLLDFIKRKVVRLDQVEILVLDEADRMLDMGFIPDVRQIIGHTPQKERRQTLFFSATMTPEVIRLADQWTKESISVDIEPEQMTVDTVDQKVYMITAKEKFTLLYNLITQQNLTRVMVFCNRRDETQRLYKKLSQYEISCTLLSGDVPQQKRMKRLEDFRAGKIRVLVATDVAGRGIHIDGISHVVNFNLPHEPENYVHRIGRTARAGASGTSVSFADEEEAFYLPDIEEFIGRKLVCVYPEDELLNPPPPIKETAPSSRRNQGKDRGRKPSRGRSQGRRPPRSKPRRQASSSQ